jgi:hypothetical protein
MSRSLWHCRNRDCPVPHGAVLGRVTKDGGLVLAAEIVTFRVFLDTKRVVVCCPHCGRAREFRGSTVFSSIHHNIDLRPAT